MTPAGNSFSTNVSSHPDPTGDRRTILPVRRDSGAPPTPSPPKPVAVDDMISQLRTPEGGKRRRRSEQPIYASRRRRRIIIGLVLGISTLILGSWYGFRFFQRLRLEGETFRDGLNRRISNAIGCQVEFTRIHDGGDSSLSAVEGRFDTNYEELLASGDFTGINARLTSTSWVSSEWGIEQLSITRGTLTFDPQRAPTTADSMRFLTQGSERKKDGGFRFSIDPEPGIITLDKLRFTSGLDIEWPSGATNRKPEAIRGLRGHADIDGPGEMSGRFTDGIIALKEMPPMTIEEVNWRVTGRQLEILGAILLIGSGDARSEVSGKANLARDGSLDLKVSIQNTLLNRLLPIAWHERVGGMFSVKEATFQSTFGKGPERRFEGDFTLEGGILRGLPFLNKLAIALQRPDFSQVEFPQLTGHFAWSPSTGLEISNLAGDKDGVLRLAGSVKVNGTGLLSGRLKASASELALRTRSRDLPHPFGSATGGWASVDFNLSGNATLINDDIILPGTSAIRAPSPPPAPSKDEIEKKFNELIPQ